MISVDSVDISTINIHNYHKVQNYHKFSINTILILHSCLETMISVDMSTMNRSEIGVTKQLSSVWDTSLQLRGQHPGNNSGAYLV